MSFKGYFLIMLLMAVPITSKKNKVKKLQEAVNKLKQDFLESQDQNEELKNNVSTLNTDFLELQAENEELKNNFSAFNNDLSINAEKIELLENNQAEAECLSLGDAYVFVLGQCYYVETTNLFSIANDSIENCHDKFGPTGSGRLFEPKDILTNDAVARVVSTTFPAFNRWIIGVNDKMEENAWRYNSGGTIPFNLPWSIGSPSNSGGNEDCVEVWNKKDWNDIPCTHSSGHIRPSICENAAAIECLSFGHSYTYVLGKCYYVEMDSFNYADAMDNCQNNFGSGNSGKLFEPRNAATNDQVIKFAARTMLPSTNQKIYIGMNDLVKEGTFQYATGGDLVYTNWYSGEPNNSGGVEDCAETWWGTTWNDINCGSKQPSICEMI